MLSVLIVSIEGFFFPDLEVIKAISFTNLRGGTFTYKFSSDQEPDNRNWPSIRYIEKNIHRMLYWSSGMLQLAVFTYVISNFLFLNPIKFLNHVTNNIPGLRQDQIRDVVHEFCKDSLVVVPNILTARLMGKYIRKSQILDLQNRRNVPVFAFPREMSTLCGRDDHAHNPRHCTVCKNDYILSNTDYKYLV